MIFKRLTGYTSFSIALICLSAIFSLALGNIEARENSQDDSLNEYFLSKSKVEKKLKKLFIDPNMFESIETFQNSGFIVWKANHQLMVGVHPSLPKYLIKKFDNTIPQSDQLSNYIKRINGAKTLQNEIDEHKYKHLIVPKKWLFALPKNFSKTNENTYLLIAEKIDILPEEEVKLAYYNMRYDVLTEFCTILYDLGGCDALLRNQPFTRSGKIAFVDTEHVGKKPDHFHKYIIPSLNPDMQEFASSLFSELKGKEKQNSPQKIPQQKRRSPYLRQKNRKFNFLMK